MASPGQIGRGALVVTMDAARSCPAQRAGCRRGRRPEDGDHLVIYEMGVFEQQSGGIG